MPPSKSEKIRGPKTELDEKFLSVARQVMKAHGVTSDRAISLALGRKADFINRVSNGAQSATPEAWDALLHKYPEARTITTTNVMSQGGGQAVGTVQGDNHYTHNSLESCQLELDQHKRELAAARGEIELLRVQLAAQVDVVAAKDALIAAQAENLSLLRGGYNRPN